MAVVIYFYFLANCQPLVIDIFSHHIDWAYFPPSVSTTAVRFKIILLSLVVIDSISFTTVICPLMFILFLLSTYPSIHHIRIGTYLPFFS